MPHTVILWKNTQNGRIGFISDEGDEVAVFENREQAENLAVGHALLRAFPYQIVEIEM